ncbi:MAG TPA: S41 family peptidase [Bacteroidales bacterium]|nr:S41 family peptidase [Bacteroidales bacterium]
MKSSYFLVLALLIVLMTACEKKEDPVPDLPTEDEAARDALYSIMKTYYLWYKDMPSVKKEDYADPYELLEAMRYRKLDRWSYIQTYKDFLDQVSATFVGHGIRIGLDQNNKTRIAQIYNKSPMYDLGVRRGWIIKKLNGTELAPIFISGDGAAYNALIGKSEAGITNTFLFETPEGKDSTITTTKATFTLNTVLLYDTLHLKTGITGHLVFEQFVEPSKAELETAFAYFQANNVKDLIVDLRYNGGGNLTVLQSLAAHIAGSSKYGEPFLTLSHNDLNIARDKTYTFATVASSVASKKMVVITTRSTGSASEDLINGLKPFMEITTIGDTTNGKPVGMYGFKHKELYYYWPISFELLNTLGQGDFYDGFAPKKYVMDDITHDWNDRGEYCLKEAIYYLENGSVSSKGEYQYRRATQFDEGNSKPNNLYLIENN